MWFSLNHPEGFGLVTRSAFASNHVMSCLCYSWGASLLQYFTGLECGHKFCMQCWGDYLTTKIIEEGMGQVPTTFILWHEALLVLAVWLMICCFPRPFPVLLIVVTFWLMTTQSCEYRSVPYLFWCLVTCWSAVIRTCILWVTGNKNDFSFLFLGTETNAVQ